MATDNTLLPSLMSFISQPAPAAPDLQSLMLPVDQAAIERARKDRFMKQAAEQSGNIFGQPRKVSKYEMSEGELMEGEMPISGLSKIDQIATGIYDDSVPMSQRMSQMNQRMMASQNPLYQQQAFANIGSMQQAASPTPDMRNFGFAQDNPAFADYQRSLRRSGATTINTGAQAFGRVPDEVVDSMGLAGTYFYDKNGIPKPVGETSEGRISAQDTEKMKVRTTQLEAATKNYLEALGNWRTDRTNMSKRQAALTAKNEYDFALAARMNWQGEPSEIPLRKATESVPGPTDISQLFVPGDPTLAGLEAMNKRFGIDIDINDYYQAEGEEEGFIDTMKGIGEGISDTVRGFWDDGGEELEDEYQEWLRNRGGGQ